MPSALHDMILLTRRAHIIKDRTFLVVLSLCLSPAGVNTLETGGLFGRVKASFAAIRAVCTGKAWCVQDCNTSSYPRPPPSGTLDKVF